MLTPPLTTVLVLGAIAGGFAVSLCVGKSATAIRLKKKVYRFDSEKQQFMVV